MMNTMDITVELMRKDRIIEEQQRRILQLELEVDRCKKQIDELLFNKEKYTKSEAQKCEEKAQQSRYWTPEEHQRFLEAVKKFGLKDVKAVAAYVGTRNPTQVRTHAQKYYLRLERERNKHPSDPSKLDELSSAAESDHHMEEKKPKKNSKKSNSEHHRDLMIDDSEGIDSSPISDTKASISSQPEGNEHMDSSKVVPIIPEHDDEKKPSKKKAAPAKKKTTLPNIAEVQALLSKSSSPSAPITTSATTVSTTLGPTLPEQRAMPPQIPQMPPQTPNFLSLSPQQPAMPNSYADSHRSAVTQALAAETADAVLSILKSWSLQEYTSFVEGLVTYGNERDINKRCRMISERFLPKYTPEEIRHCYLILQSHVAQTKSKNAAKDSPSPPVQAPPGYGAPLASDFSGFSNKRPRTSPPTHYFENQTGGVVPVAMPSAMNPYDSYPTYRYPPLGERVSPPTPYYSNTPPNLGNTPPGRLFLSPLNAGLSDILNNNNATIPSSASDPLRPSSLMEPFYFNAGKQDALPFENSRRSELEQQSDFTDPAFFGTDVNWDNTPGGEMGQDYPTDNFTKAY